MKMITTIEEHPTFQQAVRALDTARQQHDDAQRRLTDANAEQHSPGLKAKADGRRPCGVGVELARRDRSTSGWDSPTLPRRLPNPESRLPTPELAHR